MPERTRRQFLEGAVAAAAVTVLAPPALAAARSAPAPAAAAAPSAPVGPTAPFGTYQSEIYVAGMTADQEPIFTTNLSDL
jgi:hypothetical protein